MKVTPQLRVLLVLTGLFFVFSSQPALAAVISSETATPSSTQIIIQWTTDIEASSQVLYGSSTSYGSQTTEIDTSPRVTSHSVTVSGLTPCTTYHFQAKSVAVSYANTVMLSDDIVGTTSGCTTATATPISTSVPTATPTAVPLAETGDAPYLYLVLFAAFSTVLYSIGKLRTVRVK